MSALKAMEHRLQLSPTMTDRQGVSDIICSLCYRALFSDSGLRFILDGEGHFSSEGARFAKNILALSFIFYVYIDKQQDKLTCFRNDKCLKKTKLVHGEPD